MTETVENTDTSKEYPSTNSKKTSKKSSSTNQGSRKKSSQKNSYDYTYSKDYLFLQNPLYYYLKGINENDIIVHSKTITTKSLEIEYNSIKSLEKDKPDFIKNNIQNFENYIILPLYAKINSDIKARKLYYSEMASKYLNIIKKVLEEKNAEKTLVQPYGSMMNNFMVEDNESDLDICIVPHNMSIEEFSPFLDDIQKEIKHQGIGTYIKCHSSDRYALLKMKDNVSQATIDMTVHTMLPIYNTKMIRLYSLYDQRFHILGLYLKHWVKKNKINGATDKYLSSYALLILLIHFLQTEIYPIVLPILQKVNNTQKMYTYSHSGTDFNVNVYFEENIEEIEKYINIINNNQKNTDSVGLLLVKFLEFYCYKYSHENLISISESEQKKSNTDNIAFPIKDPFDADHNPGKSMKLNTPQSEIFISCMKKHLNRILMGDFFHFGNKKKNNN